MKECKPHPANVPGDFYVEEGCCTRCGVPFVDAPALFGVSEVDRGDGHCFVKRQPETSDELTQMLNVIRHAELMCIRYRGSDRQIQLELVATDSGIACDHLAPDLQQRVLDQEADRKRRWKLAQKPWWKLWG